MVIGFAIDWFLNQASCSINSFLIEGGSVWRPPALNPYSQGMPDDLISDDEASEKGSGDEGDRRSPDRRTERKPDPLKYKRGLSNT
jgi:hypothetical protein